MDPGAAEQIAGVEAGAEKKSLSDKALELAKKMGLDVAGITAAGAFVMNNKIDFSKGTPGLDIFGIDVLKPENVFITSGVALGLIFTKLGMGDRASAINYVAGGIVGGFVGAGAHAAAVAMGFAA